jgi:hypothetical protein
MDSAHRPRRNLATRLYDFATSRHEQCGLDADDFIQAVDDLS